MREIPTSSISHRWVVVLAGGDGLRMQSITKDSQGRHVPKQFCQFSGDGSPLTHALARATTLVPRDRIIVVVQEKHHEWWDRELASIPRKNVIVQASNRGTGVAVLHAVSRVIEYDRDPHFVFLPSDQEVEDETVWRWTLQRIAEAAVRWPEHLLVVGIEPQSDPDYGWLLPGDVSADETRSVLSFSEKPSRAEALRLSQQGGLCSTFIFASSAGALLRLFGRHAPDLLTHSMTGDDTPACDFSRDVLERAPEVVRVLRSASCGWTDLGTPARLERWLVRRPLVSPAPPIISSAECISPQSKGGEHDHAWKRDEGVGSRRRPGLGDPGPLAGARARAL